MCAGGARGEGEGLPGLAARGDHAPQEEGAAVQDGAGRAAGQGEEPGHHQQHRPHPRLVADGQRHRGRD